nr:PREDICTED: uncharacterized protein LOC102362810 isoform X2 [Latimeria chalumnae]|eukprot:XP_014352108.1 PREDICTED: uncharacterized protein LOC102362810 isoform X2 [Latimeria chalumnae]
MTLAGSLGSDWKCLAIEHMGLSASDVQQCENNHKELRYQAFDMLTTWKKRKKHGATVDALIANLNKANVDISAWDFLDTTHQGCDIKCNHVAEVMTKASNLANSSNQALQKLLQDHKTTKILIHKVNRVMLRLGLDISGIQDGCIEFSVLIPCYRALLHFIPPLLKNQKEEPLVKKAIREVLSEAMKVRRIRKKPIPLSINIHFHGQNYRHALLFFSGGYSMDDLFLITSHKVKYKTCLQYLSIDAKRSCISSVNDLKKAFIDQHCEKLQLLKREVKQLEKAKQLQSSSCCLIGNLINNYLTRPEYKNSMQQKRKLQRDKARKDTSIKRGQEDKSCEEMEDFKVKSKQSKTVKETKIKKLKKLQEPFEKEQVKKARKRKVTNSAVKGYKEKGKPGTSSFIEEKTNPVQKDSEGPVRHFEVVLINSLKRKPTQCYGCKKPLNDGKNFDLILRTQDYREFYTHCRMKHKAHGKSNVYFHLSTKCIEKKYKSSDPTSISISEKIKGSLSSAQQVAVKTLFTMALQEPSKQDHPAKLHHLHPTKKIKLETKLYDNPDIINQPFDPSTKAT